MTSPLLNPNNGVTMPAFVLGAFQIPPHDAQPTR